MAAKHTPHNPPEHFSRFRQALAAHKFAPAFAVGDWTLDAGGCLDAYEHLPAGGERNVAAGRVHRNTVWPSSFSREWVGAVKEGR
jgi:hypothetical protein